jgi:hypothetical protein
MRTRGAAALAVLILLAAAGAEAKPKSKPKSSAAPKAPPITAPTAVTVRAADGDRIDLDFDGPLRGWAVPRKPGQGRTLYVLIGTKAPEPGTAPCEEKSNGDTGPSDSKLYRWNPASPESIELVGSGLPRGTLEFADVDGDGADDLLLVRAGRVDRITGEPTASARPLLADPALGASCCSPSFAWDPRALADGGWRVSVVGGYRTYRATPEGRASIVSDLPLPERVQAGGERIRIDSPPPMAVGRVPATGRMLYAAAPEALGTRRIRTVLLDPDGPPETRSQDNFALLPASERVVDSECGLRDGVPVLVVTTTSGEKLNLLGEKALRIYPLGGDRSRAGDAPLFAATTGINLWQTAFPTFLDLDRDGHDDLVLAYWKGLKNAIAALEVYPGAAGGGFGKSKTTTFDVEEGHRGVLGFGDDADGDGSPDLVVLAGHDLLVFPGAPPAKALDAPVSTKPSRRIALPGDLEASSSLNLSVGPGGFTVSRTDGGAGAPHFVDMEGDSRKEVLFIGNRAAGTGRAIIVSVRGVAASPTISSVTSGIRSGAAHER